MPQQGYQNNNSSGITTQIQSKVSLNSNCSTDNQCNGADGNTVIIGGLCKSYRHVMHVMMQGPKACMGPGTGLGQANLYWSENFGDYRVWPSEGAHASFAPRGWKQRALQTHVERQLGYCEVEHVSVAPRQPPQMRILTTNGIPALCGQACEPCTFVLCLGLHLFQHVPVVGLHGQVGSNGIYHPLHAHHSA